MHYFINLGSNLGNRRLNLSRAVNMLAARYGWFELSHAVESEPWGYESLNKYLNIGMTFVSNDTPDEVLKTVKDIEKTLGSASHRNADGGYADRLIDIDIVAVDEEIIDTPDLQVPHPQLTGRRFFLEPMAELAPMWHHPVNGLTCSEMLTALDAETAREK